MIKLVSNTPEVVVRQRQLEEKVRVNFAVAAANVLRFIADGDNDVVEPTRQFIAIHDGAAKETTDPKGVAIRVPDISQRPRGQPDPDNAINTVLRGALLMTAALIKHNGRTNNADYKKAKIELAEGFVLMNKKIAKQRHP